MKIIVLLKIKVKTQAKEDVIEPLSDSGYKDIAFLIKVKASPTKGKANQAVINLLANHFNLSKSCILIKKGLNSKIKMVEIKN